MPVFEFVCQSCGHTFEKLCKTGVQLAEIGCPACGEKNARKRISGFCSPGTPGGGSDCGSCSSGCCGSCRH